MKRLYLLILLLIFILPAYAYADTIYTVKKGDSLYRISKKFGVTIKEIQIKNNIVTSHIKAGTKIVIPIKDRSQYIINTYETEYYTVKRGDTLSGLARRFSISVNELKEINNLRTTKIKPGQQLLVKQTGPRTYEEEIEGVSESEELGLKEKLILFAKKLLNIPYRFGGSSLRGIDCSAYVRKVYSKIGIYLPRTAREQFNEGRPIDTRELSIGDLVFFRTYASFPSHVGIYLGNNLFIHASSGDKKVRIDSLQTPYYSKRFIGAKRLIEEDDRS